ncbi:selenium metabolism-associated LysR family transcriptional regulator [Salibacterium sp. K-3]
MNEKQLQLFVELVQCRSFSRTAENLNTSQSTVTKQLQALEHELGAPLIQRQQVVPTEEGEMVHEKAQHFLHEWGELRRTCRQRGENYTQTLRIGAGTTPGTYFLPDLCKECHHRYPHWRLHLHIDDSEAVLQLLEDNQIDVAVTGREAGTSRLVSSAFWKDRLAVIAPPGEDPEPFDCFSELKARSFVKRKQASGTYQAVDEGLKNWGGSLASLETAAVVPNTESLVSLVEAGVGFGFLSEYALPSAEAAGCVFKGYLPHERNFHLVYDRRHQNDSLIQAFLEVAEHHLF